MSTKLFVDPSCAGCEHAICDDCDSNNMVDLFKRNELRDVLKIVRSCRDLTQLSSRVMDEVVTDEVMRRIDLQTGQQNDLRYMAYRAMWAAEKHPQS